MSDSLAEYIADLRQKGFDEQQVRDYLKKQNYPKSMIDAAFMSLGPEVHERKPGKPHSTKRKLASYISTYLAQGYDEGQLAEELRGQGFKDHDIERAIAEVTGTVRHEHHLPAATIIKLLFILFVIAGLAYAVLLLSGGEGPVPGAERLLDVTLALDATALRPGDVVTATAEVTNKGAADTYDVELRFTLVDDDGRSLWTATATKAVTTSFIERQEVPIPADMPDGSYELKVVAIYGGETDARAARSISVQAEGTPPIVKPPIIIDDDDPPPIVIIKNEKHAAKDALLAASRGDGPEARRLCLTIAIRAERDGCLEAVVLEDRDPAHCAAINFAATRDNCYLGFVLEGDYSLCSYLQGEEAIRLCQDLKRIESLG